MGTFEKYAARTFFFWMTRFLRTRYERVQIEFIAHHTEARLVSEEEFFTRGESGGTVCSSAYQLALDRIRDAYPPQRYNIYPVHFSDGDNLTSDNERCLKLVQELMDRCNIFAYGEVNQYQRSSSLMSAFKNVDDRGGRFRCTVIREKGEVYQALRNLFSQAGATPGGQAG